jgi:hypothetical protein
MRYHYLVDLSGPHPDEQTKNDRRIMLAAAISMIKCGESIEYQNEAPAGVPLWLVFVVLIIGWFLAI